MAPEGVRAEQRAQLRVGEEHGGLQVQEQRRVRVLDGVEVAGGEHPRRASDELLLVGAGHWVGKAVAHPPDAQPGGQGEDQAERAGNHHSIGARAHPGILAGAPL